MKRPFVLLVVAVALSGCGRTNSLVPIDPFFGPTTVPPPRTGIRPSADPYYSNTRQATLPERWPRRQPGAPRTATRPPVADRYRPLNGSFQYQGTSIEPIEPSTEAVSTVERGDRISIPAAAGRDLDWSTMVAAAGGDDAPSNLKAAGSEADASRVDPFVRQTSTSAPINIMDLPPVAAEDELRTTSTSVGGFVRPVSTSENDTGSVVRTASQGNARFRVPKSSAAGPAASRFGFDPEYTWLRGKLEYSEIDRRWKLRYIPIDGTTDEFGGSVVLEETSRLEGSERGDFVEVRGQIAQGVEGDRGYAPNFKISQIERLGR